MMLFVRTLLFTLLLSLLFPVVLRSEEATATNSSVTSAPAAEKRSKSRETQRITPTGERGRAMEKVYTPEESADDYTMWKRHLPFALRKLVIFLELGLLITLGVVIGQALEMTGVLNRIAIIAWPLLWLGSLPRQAGMAFLVSFQSGRVANTMLASYRDEGLLDGRELYTAVLVVSSLSLFAHLPTFIIPFGMGLGWEAASAFFAVRLFSILLQLAVILSLSRWLVKPWLRGSSGERSVSAAAGTGSAPERLEESAPEGSFAARLLKRCRGTLLRLLLYMVPTFVLISALEHWEVFDSMALALPEVFAWSFLPPQAPAIVAAQAVNLYNGGLVAANFVDMGSIDTRQAVIVLLFGSMLTAPVRTLKHALPTYLSVFGARPGTILALSAQVLRMFFLFLCTLLLVLIW